MFSSALKGFSSSNITSNYSVSSAPTSTAGPWKIYDAKKKSTGKPCSVFVFERKSLEAHGQTLGRSSASAIKRATDEVVERLRKEASSLARLRHPSVLELVEPVEETRGGGLQFATEAVTASLASLLQEKDEQESAGGVGGRSSRYVTEDSDGTRRRRELELDELEIQKGLLQISKALEFLHENAGLVHGNLTPDAILVNAKSDWKLSGMGFCSPPENSTKPTSVHPVSLSEILNLDPRLPRWVQLNLDYTSPDFVLDNNLTSPADMFSLGLLCIALYNSPHRSPLDTSSSISAYRRLFSSSSTVPNANNGFLSSRSLPKDLAVHVLPRLITRRPAQRMTAKEFQESEFFNNILVSTIRFLDSFPAKTPNEKAQFMKGLNKVLPSFPKSVMEKKILPALLEELKDKELISLILPNVFKIIELLPSSKRAFGEKVRPRLKEIFVTSSKSKEEKDPAKDAGLMVVLENTSAIADNCSGKDFKDDILPVIIAAIEAPTPALVDAALRGLPVILPVLDFSTIKNELFPVIATVFSKTNSLAIKVRGLRAFVILCGGSNDPSSDDGLDGYGIEKKKTSSSSALDKYTMQEKIVPLTKAIKTKEPAVMMAALDVLKVVGNAADADFVAMDILPVLWGMSLGPLLDLKQFQAFMELIKSLSRRVEDEQTKKLQELSGGSNGAASTPAEDFLAFGGITGTSFDATNGANEDDFETLVKGKTAIHSQHPMDAGWDAPQHSSGNMPSPLRSSQPTPTFSWSTPSPTTSTATMKHQQAPTFRTVTPDLASFQALTPSSTQFSKPLQPTSGITYPSAQQASTSANWGATIQPNPWASSTASSLSLSNATTPNTLTSSMPSMSFTQRPGIGQPTISSSSFSLPPPPGSVPSLTATSLSLPPPPGGAQRQTSFGSQPRGMAPGVSSMNNPLNSELAISNMNHSRGGTGNSMNSMNQSNRFKQSAQDSQKSGLDKYESLI